VAAGDNGCYQCLASNNCIDYPARDFTGQECGDLSGNLGGSGTGAGQAQSTLCLATVQCILDTGCENNEAQGPSYCYCGTAGGSPTDCLSNGASANGPCFAAEAAGFPFGATDGHDIVTDFDTTSYPSGMANAIFECSAGNGCPCPQ
jgi:hypothetical protein